MIIDLAEYSAGKIYNLFIQTIIPRPVAWVLTDNGNDTYNLAPISYFNGISSSPPLIMISVGKKPDGSLKDTWLNIAERDHFVIHIAHRELAEQVTASSRTLPHGESEVDLLGLQTVPFGNFSLPRLVTPRIAFACEKHEIFELGSVPQGVILGRVLAVHLDESIATMSEGRLKVDARKLDPLARLGGNEYGLLGDIIEVERPK